MAVFMRFRNMFRWMGGVGAVFVLMICFSGVPTKAFWYLYHPVCLYWVDRTIAIDPGLIQSATCWAFEVDAAHEAGGGMHKEVMI